ncbi:galactosylceramide sulfotransferase-like [Ornithodoros turicata]|uniref:galactosylceramide sulfotransferase-like n=1 Tax=Ornithodoros turicata TaxID=34597 RepID=UPI003139C8B4
MSTCPIVFNVVKSLFLILKDCSCACRHQYSRTSFGNLLHFRVLLKPTLFLLLLLTCSYRLIAWQNVTPGSCSPAKNIVFLKTHQCAGSTVQNILLRYGHSRELWFAVPASDIYLGYPRPFHRSMVPTRHDMEYNILAHHSRYSNRSEYTSVVSGNAFFVTILRSPDAAFESLASYLKSTSDIHIDDFQDTHNMAYFELYLSGQRIGPRGFGVNQMAFDLGYDVYTPNNARAIAEFIARIDGNMDLVMIADMFDESLILLKEALCWTLDDVIAFQRNTRPAIKASAHRLPENVRKVILTANFIDYALYRHFKGRLEAEIEHLGRERVMAQVGELRRKRLEWYADCVESEEAAPNIYPPDMVHRNDVLAFKIKNPPSRDPALCRMLTYNELQFTDVIRRRQLLDLSVLYFLPASGCGRMCFSVVCAVLTFCAVFWVQMIWGPN